MSSSLIATDATQIDAEIAIFWRMTTGTITMTSIPNESVMIPLSVGTKSSANAATMARSLFHCHLRYSS